MPRLLIAAALLATTLAAQAQGPVKVEDAWVRATVAPQTATGAFMQLTSAKPLKVVAASSPLAAQVEIHEMKMEDGVMKMRAVEALPLPAGQAVALKPGSYHVMLMGLQRPIKAGETVPLTLTVEGEDRQRTAVEVKAEARGAR
ncbi:copper chaperone PCu(A)C [Pelomonas aquatica]|jgi:copper(I)-binding protein|uniref:Copper chaperone PCu(A)C n=1 Tax=Pelomonas aquatica TaxID=431058 RepID=A0A9X4LES8_9BURK|nr:copper chaperone PCu(A)C [Pelomonas aquatica]MCY4752942.1 copper chaperone PCu(A)C [Pelomonas aquatica]MDG0862117.1 copper chaperone PCu(A)C [Pelomonas aquatica]